MSESRVDLLRLQMTAVSIPKDAQEVWLRAEVKYYHCTYCGDHWSNDALFCPKCKEYKGVMPCVPGYCDWGESHCVVCGGAIDTTYQGTRPGYCFACNFWETHYQADLRTAPHETAVIEGHHYRIGSETADSVLKGYGGRQHTIAFKDGTKVITTNLWHQGKIPKWFLKVFPNNAEFEAL